MALRAARADAPSDDFSLGARDGAAVERDVVVVEALQQLLQKRRVAGVAVRQRDRDLVALADMTHVDGVRVRDVGVAHTAREHDLAALLGERVEHPLHGDRVPVGHGHRQARRQVGCDRRAEQADRRRDAGAERADHLADAELARDAVRMHRTGAAERNHRQRARVDAAVGGLHRSRFGHAFVDHVVDAPCATVAGDVEVVREARHRGIRRGAVEREVAAEERALVDVAEQQVGVCHRRLGAAAAVARGAGRGRRAARADLERAELGARRDAAAAGADLDHVDRLDLQREAAALAEALVARDFELVRNLWLAVRDQAQLRRRAAHVERQHALLTGSARVVGRGHRAGRRAGFDQSHRCARRARARHHAAARGHPQQLTLDAALAELTVEVVHVLHHHRPRVGVGHRGGGAVVFAHLGAHGR